MPKSGAVYRLMEMNRARAKKEIVDLCGYTWIYDPASRSIYMKIDTSKYKEDTIQHGVKSHADAIGRLIELGHLEAPDGYESDL